MTKKTERTHAEKLTMGQGPQSEEVEDGQAEPEEIVDANVERDDPAA